MGSFCIVAIVCNIRSSVLARKSVLIASKPFKCCLYVAHAQRLIDEASTKLAI